MDFDKVFRFGKLVFLWIMVLPAFYGFGLVFMIGLMTKRKLIDIGFYSTLFKGFGIQFFLDGFQDFLDG